MGAEFSFSAPFAKIAYCRIKYYMKKYFAAIISLSLAICLLFLPAFNVRNVDITEESSDKKVIKVFHADVTSGGKNSRGVFLQDMAREYNSLQSDVFVIVSIYEKDELLFAAQKDKADIISFGSGLSGAKEYLSPYCGRVSFSDEFLSAVTEGGEIYAVPWSYGGYFLVGEGEKVLTSKEGSPLAALFLTFENKLSQTDEKNMTEECYAEFLRGKNLAIVCTNKELSKILVKVERGHIKLPKITPLCGFTDMVNLLGVTKECGQKDEAEAFISYLTSQNVQKKLSRLNLFSPCSVKVYSSGSPFSEYEKGRINVKNVFSLEVANELARLAFHGDENARERLLEMIK